MFEDRFTADGEQRLGHGARPRAETPTRPARHDQGMNTRLRRHRRQQNLANRAIVIENRQKGYGEADGRQLVEIGALGAGAPGDRCLVHRFAHCGIKGYAAQHRTADIAVGERTSQFSRAIDDDLEEMRRSVEPAYGIA